MEIMSHAHKERAKSPSTRGKDQYRSSRQDTRGRGKDSRTSTAEGKYDRYASLKVSQAQVWKEVSAT